MIKGIRLIMSHTSLSLWVKFAFFIIYLSEIGIKETVSMQIELKLQTILKLL